MAGKGGARESNTSERRIEAVERQRKALELRKAGHGYQAIADSLGYDGPSGAYQAIRSALKKTLQEPADEVRALELTRLDHMLKNIWQAVSRGEYLAIDRALKIMARRAEYLGLDAPAKIDISVLVKQAAEQLGLTDEERAELAADVTAFIAEQKVVSP